jgi:hypothetical protein
MPSVPAVGGTFRDCEKGISLGCPLSPLIGAFFLHTLDGVAASSACSTSLHGWHRPSRSDPLAVAAR